MRLLLVDELGRASNITQIVTRLSRVGDSWSGTLIRATADPTLTRTPTGDTLNVAFEETFEFARTATSNLGGSTSRLRLAALLRKALGRPTPQRRHLVPSTTGRYWSATVVPQWHSAPQAATVAR